MALILMESTILRVASSTIAARVARRYVLRSPLRYAISHQVTMSPVTTFKRNGSFSDSRLERYKPAISVGIVNGRI